MLRAIENSVPPSIPSSLTKFQQRVNTAPAERILVVEDDHAVQKALRRLFEAEGYAVHVAPDGNVAVETFKTATPSAVVLDLRLPGLSGREVCREFKQHAAAVPIIVLSATTDVSDKVLLLELGADDYVTKPFSPRELVARIKAVLRRTSDNQVKAPDADAFAFGDWVLRTGERELVDKEGAQVPLSTGEYNLLLAFVTHPKRVLTRDQLLDLSQHREMGAFERSIDNHISRLRKKVEADPSDPKLIKTVWGGGYTLTTDVRRL
jgi:two-component system, OmpR family, response regulator